MRHFDVQLIGGAVLHKGKIAEMKTGEGKTLVATLPAYLNALEGKGVHVVTVNDYLARRDSEWMGRIYRFLGMTVGVIQHDLNDPERQVAYAADITYGTNNEFGFDYLRDNMKFELAHYVQRGHHFAIVDEVDSILIDEARTPLIISGPAEESTDLYYEVDRIIPAAEDGRGDARRHQGRRPRSARGDRRLHQDEKHKTVTLTESGMAKAEQLLAHRLETGRLYDPANMPLLHHVNQALRAHALFQRDVDYMVKDGEVVIVDEFTGRLMPGRRWSDGLHQAVEASQGRGEDRAREPDARDRHLPELLPQVQEARRDDRHRRHRSRRVRQDLQPRRRRSSRRTGCCRRVENPDLVYRTEAEKWDAIVTEIIERARKGTPRSSSAPCRSNDRSSFRDAGSARSEARDHDWRRSRTSIVVLERRNTTPRKPSSSPRPAARAP